jgi:hypothetical protein
LDGEQTKVDREGCVDGKPDLRSHAGILLDLETFFIFSTQELINELILSCVEFLRFL